MRLRGQRVFGEIKCILSLTALAMASIGCQPTSPVATLPATAPVERITLADWRTVATLPTRAADHAHKALVAARIPVHRINQPTRVMVQVPYYDLKRAQTIIEQDAIVHGYALNQNREGQ